MWGGVDDVINCANFLKIGQGVSELAYPEKRHLPLKAFIALTTFFRKLAENISAGYPANLDIPLVGFTVS